MISRFFTRGFVLVAVLFSLGGCVGMRGYDNASPEDERIVQDGGYSRNATAQILITQNPDFNGGKISPKALKKIQEYSISCQKQVESQLAGAAHATVAGAVNQGIVGLGEGPAAHAANFATTAARTRDYATFGGTLGTFFGGLGGAQSGSYAMASAKGGCTVDFWKDVANTDPDFKGTHVQVNFGDKAWGDSSPPALDRWATVPRLVR